MCALDIEYSNIKKYFNIIFEYKVDDNCEISECNNKILIVKSGVSKKLASKYTEYVIRRYKNISRIYSTGIAGAISPNLNIGDIVISNAIIDLKQGTLSKEYISLRDEELYFNILNNDMKPKKHFGKIVSSDILINNNIDRNKLYSKYNALCVEMESAGVIQICNQYQKSFLALKVVSDYADGKAIISIIRAQIKVMEYLGQLIYAISC